LTADCGVKTPREVEVEAAISVGMTPNAYRDLPTDERYELEEYILLQILKTQDQQKRERAEMKKGQKGGAKADAPQTVVPWEKSRVTDGFSADIAPARVSKRQTGRRRR